MKILHLDSGRSIRGGQKQTLLLLRGLLQRGHSVMLGCREGKVAEAAQAAKIPVVTLPLRGEWDLRTANKIARITREQSFDLIHAHDAHTHTLARIAQTLGMKTSLVVHRRVDFPIRSGFLSKWKYLKGVSAYIAISRAVGRRLDQIGISARQIYCINSSVDIETLDREVKEPLPSTIPPPTPEQKIFTCIGALEKEKGQHFLLSCIPTIVRQHESAHFYFLGEGKWKERLEQMASSLGVAEHCYFAGHVHPVAPLIKRSVCVVLPTLSEGLSTAALESMALGVPVAASAVGGLVEIIDAGETGLLFTPANLDEMELALRRLLEDPDLAPTLGSRAADKIRGEFTVATMVEKTERVYEEVIKGRSQKSGA